MNLYTVYQPIVNLDSDKIIGYESLLRGKYAPEILFQRAEKERKMIYLDVTAIQLALHSFVRSDSKIFINCRPETFVELDLLKLIENLGVNPIERGNIVIELTEHKSLTDLNKARIHADRLRKNGVSIALDDFGNGFTNLSLIDVLKPDYIKLDGALSQNIISSNRVRSLVKGLKKISDEIGATLIAEGIEGKKQRDALHDCGVNLGQGWYLGKPRRYRDIARMQG